MGQIKFIFSTGLSYHVIGMISATYYFTGSICLGLHLLLCARRGVNVASRDCSGQHFYLN